MRVESNRVSCSSQDGNGQRGDDGGCCFVVQGVTNTTEVTYAVMTGARELGDLLAEGERERGGQRQSLDCVQIHKEELVEQEEGKEKESEFWITAEVGQ